MNLCEERIELYKRFKARGAGRMRGSKVGKVDIEVGATHYLLLLWMIYLGMLLGEMLDVDGWYGTVAVAGWMS